MRTIKNKWKLIRLYSCVILVTSDLLEIRQNVFSETYVEEKL